MPDSNDTAPVLVTGGAGYVGSHACCALKAAGFVPVTYDNLQRGHRELVQFGPLEIGDILDGDRLLDVIDRYRPQAVMHFAALAYVGESVNEPGLYYRNNFAGALSVLEAMQKRGLKHFVFSSTCATYGTPERQPMTEDLPQRPINPYGHSKLMVEQALRDFDAAYGIRSVALRYFNACGAHPSGAIGEMHEPETHLIPRVLMAAAGEIDAIDVFGTDYPTPDGTAIRDYVHVCDLADAHVAAIGYLARGGATTALNLGTGRGHSVREVIDSVARVTGHTPSCRFGDRRPGDPPMLVADARRARDVLGFAPKWTDLDRIVESAWTWHQRQQHA
ncbi:MAG TPA: UDP-glucose 4-epimerase GalE [Rhizomicrobium sp.]|jgi:UDP-glucose-4-epimerase GalE